MWDIVVDFEVGHGGYTLYFCGIEEVWVKLPQLANCI